MTDATGKAQSQFTQADAIQKISKNVLKSIVLGCEQEYVDAVQEGKDWFNLLSNRTLSPNVIEAIAMSGEIERAVSEALPDAIDVRFAKRTLCCPYNGNIVHGAAYVALTEKGVQEINNNIYRENTPFLKRFGKKIGLFGAA
jgi:hypothetical protein